MAWSPPADSPPNMDSGFVTVPVGVATAVPNVPTAAVSWLEGLNASNQNTGTGVSRKLYLTDTAGNPIGTAVEIAVGTMDPKSWPFMPVTGVKWYVDGGVVVAKLWGRK